MWIVEAKGNVVTQMLHCVLGTVFLPQKPTNPSTVFACPRNHRNENLIHPLYDTL